MAIAPTDERNLIFPLFASLQKAEGWDDFLKRLLPRTGARRVCLLQRPSGASAVHAFMREVWTEAKPPAHPIDIASLENCGLMPLQSLRAERVYSLEEMRLAATGETAELQERVMAREDIRHARFVRFEPRSDASAWLIITHDTKDFSAADSALLSSVIPYLAVAISTVTAILTLRLRAEIAEEALGMIGVGQAVLDGQGQTVLADAIAEAELDLPNLRGARAETFADACKAMADKSPDARVLIENASRGAGHVLLRPARAMGGNAPRAASVVALVRRTQRSHDASAAKIVAARFGLSAREAALAIALCRGQSLIEAGEGLRLTRETARNYSKRIYAKTGVIGQADLVRMILNDLTPFA